jgi:hypothetical protein
MPFDLHQIVVTRPELSDYAVKLNFVKNHMEHARGASQANWVNGKNGAKDMDIGEITADEHKEQHKEHNGGTPQNAENPLVWSLQAEASRYAAAGDWDTAGSLAGALYALKGKGKGGKGGKGGMFNTGGFGGKPSNNKGGGKGAGGYTGGKGYDNYKGNGKGAQHFEGYCNYCSGWGHRKSQCKKLDADIGKGGGKNGSKGKDGGGKGVYNMNYEEAANDKGDDAQEEQQPCVEWWVGARFSLLRDGVTTGGPAEGLLEPQPYRRGAATRAQPVEKPVVSKPLRLTNSFSALACVDECCWGYKDELQEEYGERCDESAWPMPSARKMSKAEAKRQRYKAGHIEMQDLDHEIERHMLLLTREGDKTICAVSKDPKNSDATGGQWKLVEAVVDSGAEESVAPPGLFPGIVTASPMSRAGGKYRAANGARIPNLGQVRVPFTNDQGEKCGTTFQVAEVERPLLSASQLAASGNSVRFERGGGKIVNLKTGREMKLERRGGVFVLKMWVPINPSPGFAGQGK